MLLKTIERYQEDIRQSIPRTRSFSLFRYYVRLQIAKNWEQITQVQRPQKYHALYLKCRDPVSKQASSSSSFFFWSPKILPPVVVVVSPLRLLVAGPGTYALGRIGRRRRIHIRKQSGRRRRSTRKKESKKKLYSKKGKKTQNKTKKQRVHQNVSQNAQNCKTIRQLFRSIWTPKIPFFFFFFCLLQNGSGSKQNGTLRFRFRFRFRVFWRKED